jgi:hypothetical protein
VLFYVLFVLCRSVYCVCVCVCVCVCKCVLYYCHRVATQLQLRNMSYHMENALRAVCNFKLVSKSWRNKLNLSVFEPSKP